MATCAAVLEGEALEGWDVGRLADDLRVVGDGSGHGVTDDHDQLHVLRHGVDSLRRLHGNEVTRRLLHDDLTVQGFGHHAPGAREEQEIQYST